MRAEDMLEQQRRTAMTSPQHLKLWLEKSGRKYLTLNAQHLVDALWASSKDDPGGIEAFMQLLEQYVQHRRTLPSNRVEEVKVPTTGEVVQVHCMMGDFLEKTEADEAIRLLVDQSASLPGKLT